METTSLNKKFQSYLDQEMSGEELEAFKIELKTNAEIKKAYVAYLFQALKGPESSDVTSKEWITSVYRSGSPVKLEQPGKIYLLNRFISANWRKMAVAASLLLIVVFSYTIYISNLGSKDFNDFMSPPISMERASASPIQDYEKSSFFYSREIPQIDSLEALEKGCNGFCITKYYLAHAYLKTRQFEKAKQYFDECLLNLSFLNQIPQLQGAEFDIRLNALIVKAQLHTNISSIITELNSLVSPLEHNDPNYIKAMKFKKSLK